MLNIKGIFYSTQESKVTKLSKLGNFLDFKG